MIVIHWKGNYKISSVLAIIKEYKHNIFVLKYKAIDSYQLQNISLFVFEISIINLKYISLLNKIIKELVQTNLRFLKKFIEPSQYTVKLRNKLTSYFNIISQAIFFCKGLNIRYNHKHFIIHQNQDHTIAPRKHTEILQHSIR